MNYSLSDDVIKLKFLKNINQDKVFVFYLWNNIHTISDLLKYGKEARRNKDLQVIVQEFKNKGIKFDDELKADELKKRNEERKKMEKENRELRGKNISKELLARKIETLNLTKGIVNRLKNRMIYTVEDLIDGTSYIFFQKDTEIFKQKELKMIEDALLDLGLHFNMINPITGEIEHKDEFKTERVEEKTEAAKPEVVKPDEEAVTKEPENIPVKPRKKQSDIDAWNRQYEYLKIFFNYFGHIFIPKAYKIPKELKEYDKNGIGEWIVSQRKAYHRTKRTITPEEIKKLELLKMSWEGIGNKIELKNKYYRPLNIEDVKLDKTSGILYTYYLDGTVKSTNDKEFVKMLKGEVEEKIELPKEIIELMDKNETISESDSYDEIRNLMKPVIENLPEDEDLEEKVESKDEERETEATSNDTYSLMRKRIDQMKSQRSDLLSENERKRKLIEEYRKLVSELKELTEKGLELDGIINGLLGIENAEENVELNLPKTLDDTTTELLSSEISKKKEDNQRKQELIDEFRMAETELNKVQDESDKLDYELSSLLTPSNDHVKKRGDL